MQTADRAREEMNRGIQRESFGELLGELANNSAALVRDEIELAKQEMREKVSVLRSGAVTIAIGGLLGLVALLTLTAAAVAGLAHVMDTALAALLVGVVIAAVGGSIAFIGIGRLKRTSLKPQQTIETLEEDKEWLKQIT
ncbi:MAG TPA: phage holin family protein [Blastocatellia bacterium]|nr:phage holin family protein [Blastocatellia bacterium]